jgi:hypothetical protein
VSGGIDAPRNFPRREGRRILLQRVDDKRFQALQLLLSVFHGSVEFTDRAGANRSASGLILYRTLAVFVLEIYCYAYIPLRIL